MTANMVRGTTTEENTELPAMPKTCTKRVHQERKHITDKLTPRRQGEKSTKDMQDDASKEGNNVDAAIISLPTQKQTKLSHGKTNGWRSKPSLQSQLHAAHEPFSPVVVSLFPLFSTPETATTTFYRTITKAISQ
jgi:hypothetical protein